MESPKPTILLIEKEEVTLEIYQRELRKSFEVLATTRIDGLLRTLKKQSVRAVIIEPEIHSGQGWNVISSIQAAFPDQSIPVIVCSTRDACNDRLHEGIARYLTKPVLPKTLRETVLEILANQEAQEKT